MNTTSGVLRRWFSRPDRQRRLARPVVSVGNISFGGRGKTPVVAHLAELLIAAGERPAILTRGYGRRRPAEGVVVVSDGTRVLAGLDEAGDEPLMLARAVPGAAVLVSPDRALAGVLAEEACGVTVHLLDDGFQHWRLARDIDLVIVTPEDLKDRRAPFGRLREGVSALAAADAVIVDSGENDTRYRFAENAKNLERYGVSFSLERKTTPGIVSRSFVAVAGIAQPERFFSSVAEAGWTVAATMPFADHHLYSRGDVDRIARTIASAGATGMLTTAKDAVRFEPHGALPFAMTVVPLTVTIEPAAAFRAWLLARLAEARR